MQIAGFLNGSGLMKKLLFHFLILSLFTLLNVIFHKLEWAEYNKENMSWFDVVDYSIVTWMTVGFGNVYPTNAWGKIMSWAQMTAFLVLILA